MILLGWIVFCFVLFVFFLITFFVNFDLLSLLFSAGLFSESFRVSEAGNVPQ